MTWPFEAWDGYHYSNGQMNSIEHHPSGHEQVWFNGVSMNGTASWVTVAIVTGIVIVTASDGAFE